MSSEWSVYIGVYFKVFMPKEKYISLYRICPKCKRSSPHDYCRDDGTKTEPVEAERMIDFYGLCREIFGNGDQFTTGNIRANDFYIVMANQEDQPGHLFVDENELEQTIPEDDSTGDWTTLGNALFERGIVYIRCFGVVSYFM